MYTGDIIHFKCGIKEDLYGIKMNTSSNTGGAGREQIVDFLGRATLTEVSWWKDSSKLHCGLILSEDRPWEHKFSLS